MGKIEKYMEEVSTWTEDELRILNRGIVGLINDATRTREAVAAINFKKGDKVKFEAQNQLWSGTVVKVNQKTVIVRAKTLLSNREVEWKVAPTLLTKE